MKTHITFFIVLFLLSFFSLEAQTQLGNDIEGKVYSDESGRTVAFSDDGNRLAIAVSASDAYGKDVGYVSIFDWNGSNWAQVGNDIIGEAENDFSGTSLAFSSGGGRLAIGSHMNDGESGSDSGHVRVFDWNGSSWVQVGNDIDGEDAGDGSGWSVALSSDGFRLAIGAPFSINENGINAGHVRVFDWIGNNWEQLGSPIIGEGEYDRSGYSVTLSADGNRIAIGAPLNDVGGGSYAGHVRVFDWNGTGWIQTGNDIDGRNEYDQFGSSIAFSTDGNRLAIGAQYSDSGAGHVRVLDWDGSSWVQAGIDLGGDAEDDNSGTSIAISNNGNRLAVGAPGNDGTGRGAGHVKIYDWNGSGWVQTVNVINGEAEGDLSGISVALSADGGKIAIGAPGNDGLDRKAGHVRIYELSGGSLPAAALTLSSNNLTFTDTKVNQTFQLTLSMANTGTVALEITSLSLKSESPVNQFNHTVFTGTIESGQSEEITITFSPNSQGDKTAVLEIVSNDANSSHQVTLSGTGVSSATATQMGNDIDGEAAGDQSGRSVAFSADGNRLAIGAPYNNGGNGTSAGHVRVFDWNGISWAQVGNDIDGEANEDLSGWSVSLSADGNRLAIGATLNDGENGLNSGHVRVFDWNGSDWLQVGNDIDGEASGDFSGQSVALSSNGDRIAIGSIHSDLGYLGIFDSKTQAGSVRVFDWDGSNWHQAGEIIGGEEQGDLSGEAIALSANGDRLAIGASRNDGKGDNAGHVRVFNWTGSSWIQVGSDIDGEEEGDYSGKSLALASDGNRVAIGAYVNDGENDYQIGHVRVFDWNGSVWVQTGNDIDGEAKEDRSGGSVTLSANGSRLAIGAQLNDGENGVNDGHVRVFDWNGSSWIQTGNDIDGEAKYDASGASVALSADGSRVAIGAPANGSNAGHVRVYDLSGVGGEASALTLSADNLVFQNTEVNQTSELTFSIENTGNAPLEVTSLSLKSELPTGQFSHSDFTGAIEPGQSQEITATFSPNSQGDKTAVLEIVSNDANSPHQILLSGAAEISSFWDQHLSGGIAVQVIETSAVKKAKYIGYQSYVGYETKIDDNSIRLKNYFDIDEFGFSFIDSFNSVVGVFGDDFLDQLILYDSDKNVLGHIDYSYDPGADGTNARQAILVLHNSEFQPYGEFHKEYDRDWNYYQDGEYPVSMLVPPNNTMPSEFTKKPLLLVHGWTGWYQKDFADYDDFDDVGYWGATPRLINQATGGFDAWQIYYPYDMAIADSDPILGYSIDWLNQQYGKALNIATHSMGGLVTMNWLVKHSDSAKDLVNKVLFSVPPFHGSYGANRHYKTTLVGNVVEWWETKDNDAPAARDLGMGSDFIWELHNQMKNNKIPDLNESGALTDDYIVLAGTTKDDFSSKRFHEEATNHSDGVVAISSASLLNYGISLITFSGNHDDGRYANKHIKSPSLISGLIDIYFDFETYDEFKNFIVDEPLNEITGFFENEDVLYPSESTVSTITDSEGTIYEKGIINFEFTGENDVQFQEILPTFLDAENGTLSIGKNDPDKDYVGYFQKHRVLDRFYFRSPSPNPLGNGSGLYNHNSGEPITFDQIVIYPFREDDRSYTIETSLKYLQTQLIAVDLSKPDNVSSVKPEAPTAVALDATSVRVAWQPVKTALNYRLFRGLPGKASEEVYSGTSITFNDSGTGLSPDTEYVYTLAVDNAASSSVVSDPVFVTTLNEVNLNKADLRPVLVNPENNMVWIAGNSATITVGIFNNGSEASQKVQGQLFLSKSENDGGWDIPLGTPFEVNPIAPGKTNLQEIEVLIPETVTGDFYVGLTVDVKGISNDRNSPNNTKTSNERITVATNSTEQKPDLTGSFVDIPLVITKESDQQLELLIRNLGNIEPGEFSGQLYLSSNRILSVADDILLGNSNTHRSIAGISDKLSEKIQFSVPSSVALGSYYLLYQLDGEKRIDELAESNNVFISPGRLEVIDQGLVEIKGKVTNVNNLFETPKGLEGVKIEGVPGSIVTDNNGDFSVMVPKGWSGKLTAVKGDYLISPLSTALIDDAQGTTVINFNSANVLDMMRLITEQTKLLPRDIQNTIGLDLIANASDALALIKDVETIYNILGKDEEDISKYFDIAEFLVGVAGSTPLSSVASAYIYLTKEILEDIGGIADILRVRTFKFFPDKVEFLLRIEHKKSGWFTSSKKVNPVLYSPYLQARMLLYTKEGGALVLKSSKNFTEIKEHDGYDGELHLKGGTFNPHSIEFAGDKSLFLELNWLNSKREVVQRMVVPLTEPFIDEVGFASSDFFRIKLKTQKGIELDFSNGVPFLKLDN